MNRLSKRMLFILLISISGTYLCFGQAAKQKTSAEGTKTNLYGDPLPPGAITRFGMIGGAQGGFISSLVCTPDGKTVLTSSGDGTIRRWEAIAGKQRGVITRHDHGARAIALSCDGKILVSSGVDGKIQIWDLETPKKLHELTIEKASPCSLALSPDGTLLVAGCETGAIQAWEMGAGRKKWNQPGHLFSATSVSFSASGKVIASGSRDGSIQLWRTVDGKSLPCVIRHPDAISCVAFSPNDERILASGGYGGVSLWDVVQGKKLPQSSSQTIDALAFSPDGKILAYSDAAERTICLLETATGKKRCTLRGHLGRVLSLRFSLDGKILFSGSMDTTVLVWDLFATVREQAEGRKSAKDLQACWEDLLKDDGEKAYQAIGFMATRPNDTVRFLQEQVHPCAIDRQKIDSLIKELDSSEFAVRDRAFVQLHCTGKIAEPLFRSALKGTASAEMRKKLSQLVEECEQTIPSGEQLRLLRTIEVLERIGEPRCRGVLQTLARGVAGDLVYEEAEKTLRRLRLE